MCSRPAPNSPVSTDTKGAGPCNPADKVERPKKQKYIADYYRLKELKQFFEVTKDHPYSLLIQITAFYGLRRS